MGKRVQVCLSLPDEEVKRMEKVRDETGIPVGKQVELVYRGYVVKKSESSER